MQRIGVRAIASLLIFLLSAILTPVAVIGEWGHRTLTDQTTYLETMVPLATEVEVQLAVADTISEAIIAQVNTEQAVAGFLGRLLPESPLADALTAPLTTGVNTLVRDLVTRFLQSDTFIDIWTKTLVATQSSLLAVLQGEPVGPVKTANGALILDISTLLIAVQERLVEQGVGIAANITIEPDKREILLAEPAGLSQIQFIYRFAAPILTFALLLLAIGFGAAILISRRRARMTVWVGVALTGWGLVLTYALANGQQSFVNQLSGTPLGRAADQFWSIFFSNLSSGLRALVVTGLVVIVVGWVAGGSRLARSIRRRFNDAAARVQVYVPQALVGGWLARNVVVVRGIAITVAVLVFVIGDALELSLLVWSTLLGIVLVFAVQVLGSQPRAAHHETSASLA